MKFLFLASVFVLALQTRAELYNNDYVLNLLQLSEYKSDSNLVMSPAAIKLCLSIIGIGSQSLDDTIHQIFFKPTEQEKNSANRTDDFTTYGLSVLKSFDFNNQQDYVSWNTFLFLSKSIAANQTVLDLYQKHFNVQNHQVEMRPGSGEIEKIVNDKIKQFQYSPPATLVNSLLLNTVELLLKWNKIFTTQGSMEFHGEDQKVTNVTRIRVVDEFSTGFLDNMNTHYVNIPYRSNNYSMLILMPNQNSNLTTLIGQLGNDSLNTVIRNACGPDSTKKKLELIMPEFTIQSKLELQDVLNGKKINLLAINSLLTELVAQQSSKIEVNYRETKARAVTEFFMSRMGIFSENFDETLFIDRSFLYFIIGSYGNKQYEVLFAGYVNKPQTFE